MGQLQVITNCEEGSKKAISYAQLHIIRENIHMHEKLDLHCCNKVSTICV